MRRLALLPLLGAARVGVPPDQRLAAHADAVVPDPFPVFLKLKKSGSATAKRALFGRICDRGRWFWKGRCGEYQGERAPLIYGVGGRAALATCLGDKRHAAEDAVDRGWEIHVNYDKTIRIPFVAPVAPIRVFVVVREPVARLVSAFYFFGGAGGDFRHEAVIIEQQQWKGIDGFGITLHNAIIAPYIETFGSEEQKKKWLPRLASGELIAAIAMTEPGAGSDLQAIRTSAVKDGDDYILNGSKTFITNGQHADMVIVAAKTDPKAGARGISLFLVDTSLPGYSKGRNLDKIGQHSGDTSELFFSDMRIPPPRCWVKKARASCT